MSWAFLIQIAFALASIAATVAALRTTDKDRRQAAIAMFAVFLAGSTLTQALSSQERARSDVLRKLADLDQITAIGPSGMQREGLALVKDAVEQDVRFGLGPGPAALLIMGGGLLGMGFAQLLALWRAREPGRAFLAEAAE